MATNVIMPSMGFDMTEGKLARWLKNEGEPIEKGQAIAEIETEKATVEIEATMSGILQKIMVQPDQTVPVGTVIGVIGEANERQAQAAPSTSKPPSTSEQSSTSTPPSAAAPATTTVPPPNAGDGQQAREATPPSNETPVTSQEKPRPPKEPTPPSETRVKASPLARKMAEQAGIDLSMIKGTGPGGRIMDRDVEAARTAATSPRRPSSAREGEGGAVSTVPLNKMRQAIARRMTESKTTAPHFYVTVEINMTDALKLREQLNNLASDQEKISINDLVIAAAAKTLNQFQNFNASFRDNSIEMHKQINIGIAVALEDGLITPVVRDADKKSLRMIAKEAKELGERARANKLRAEDLGGSTFTVSNLGMFGVDEFIAIINPPEAAILAVGSAIERAIVIDGEIRAAPMMKATLSVDHRVADGAQAGRFLDQFRKLLLNPVNLLTT